MRKPIYCDNCGSLHIKLTRNHVLYGTDKGDWPYIYYCTNCKAAVSCHKQTFLAMGKMGDKETRRSRYEAHKHFDKLWRGGLITRKEAYAWLRDVMCCDEESGHISRFNSQQCSQLIQHSKQFHQALTGKKFNRVTHHKGRKVSKRGQLRRKRM